MEKRNRYNPGSTHVYSVDKKYNRRMRYGCTQQDADPRVEHLWSAELTQTTPLNPKESTRVTSHAVLPKLLRFRGHALFGDAARTVGNRSSGRFRRVERNAV